MKKIFIILTFMLIVFTLNCASKPEPIKESVVKSVSFDISSQNEQLTRMPISGFEYKSSRLSSETWDRWAKQAAPVVKAIISKLPDDYVLQVTGHADASGPEEPVDNKPGNIKISTNRAMTVYRALKKAGISSPKITYKGMGSSDLLENVDPKDERQRRVTFKVVSRL